MRALLRGEGLEERIELDSAGTGPWHAGEPPDARATEAARARGIIHDGIARQVRPGDFQAFDLLLALDREHERDLLELAPDDDARAKVRLLREFDPASVATGHLDVPDPYYGGARGFEHVLDLVEAACRGLLAEARAADADAT
jgi:protein-tyrosine phosphatase